jgi:hypothetical protein
MGNEAEIDHTIGLIYDSVVDDSLWPGALKALSAFTGGTGVGQVIADPIVSSASRMPGLTSTISVRRTNSASAFKITLIPIASPDRFCIAGKPSALMVIVDPEQAPRPDAPLIKAALGLTNAETALAHALFSGVSLREAAIELDRSINPCKAQLKTIYAKTGPQPRRSCEEAHDDGAWRATWSAARSLGK